METTKFGGFNFHELANDSGWDYRFGDNTFLESKRQFFDDLENEIFEVLRKKARFSKFVRKAGLSASEADIQEEIRARLLGRKFEAE